MQQEYIFKNPRQIQSNGLVPPGYGPDVRSGSLLVQTQVIGLDQADQTLFDLDAFDVELKLTRKMKPGMFRLAVGVNGESQSGTDRLIIRRFSTREDMAEHTKGKMEWVRVGIQDVDE